ncbi:phosphate starvation-inducible PhoH-like protein [Natranaerovirga pectinivora]|uniref:PhoH-like protein n=1 Tax=Natranaerovirga pectinivora TaxID=682400 RepID=A0A4R3MUS7_9FIRM|nr:PhoH family protein [Natranaerovirga pectinivora]TCT17056.1 phosphate starvation-inducible PhoH-like protein [Natranaerovirga pectinivora]
MKLFEKTIQIPNEHIINIFGQFDTHIKKIEKILNVTIVDREENVKIMGDQDNVDKAYRVLEQLLVLSVKNTSINEQNVNYLLALLTENEETKLAEVHDDLICVTINGKQIRPKTLGQKHYVDLIRKNMIVFGIGPAGTGKTFLAMAMAITAFKNNEVNRIILTRPAIEAGERLGFLPGDLQSKIDPYLRPLYDALYQIMGAETYLKNIEKGLIEVAPLAYMRGRTLDNAFIVLDEAQNTTPAQMKMFLTRIGFGSKAVITGDITQKDLPYGAKSGLEEAIKVLNNVEGIGISNLTNKDVVRHPLVQRIVTAYEKYESNNKPKEEKRSTNNSELKRPDRKKWKR